MLDAASYPALWALYDATGVRPEWLLPTLQIESGLDPSVPNAQGYPYYGLNQIAGSALQAQGIDPTDYLTWPASQQIARVVGPYVASQVATYGALRSGLKVYLANFYPAALPSSGSLAAHVVCKPARPCVPHDPDPYCANAALDVDHSGCITVGDLATLVQRAAQSPAVAAAIASAYRVRPGQPTNPTYGLDYGAVVASASSTGHAVVIAGVAAAAVYYAAPAWRWLRRRAVRSARS